MKRYLPLMTLIFITGVVGVRRVSGEAGVIPGVPTDGYPNGIFISAESFDFNWSAVAASPSGTTTYQFQSSLSPDETGGVLTANLWQSGTLLTNSIHSPGAPEGKWYWQVRARSPDGEYGNWSRIWTVTIDRMAPTVPVLMTPVNLATVQPGGNFGWQKANDLSPVTYTWEIARNNLISLADGALAEPLVSKTGLTDPVMKNFQLADGGYYWHVRAVDLAGNTSAWSQLFRVTVAHQVVPTPTLTPAAAPIQTSVTAASVTTPAVQTAGERPTRVSEQRKNNRQRRLR